MLNGIVRFSCLTVIRFFHRQIALRGGEYVPRTGPTLVVANHPNGLIDPIVVRIALGREVGFMAKAPLFENPFGKLAMESFAALPVYRAKDGKDTAANERTFAAVHQRWNEGRWVVIFPEGHSHSEPSLQKVKTGAARMSLSAEAESEDLGLQILPVGLIYESKSHFRSRVSVVAGAPLTVSDWIEQYREDDWETAQALTAAIGSALADVMLEAETDETWRGFLAVAKWTSTDAIEDMAACESRARQLSDAYRRLVADDPVRANELADEARRFVAMLESIGVANPFDLERPAAPTLFGVIRNASWYAALFVPAMVGWFLNALPYYGIGPLAEAVAGDDDDTISSIKAIAGLLFYPLTWILEATVAWYFGGLWAAIATFCAGPLSGIVAVRFFERVSSRRDAVVGTWLRFTRKGVVDAITARRQELSKAVNALLDDPTVEK